MEAPTAERVVWRDAGWRRHVHSVCAPPARVRLQCLRQALPSRPPHCRRTVAGAVTAAGATDAAVSLADASAVDAAADGAAAIASADVLDALTASPPPDAASAAVPWPLDALVSFVGSSAGVDVTDVLAAEQADHYSLFSSVPYADAVLPLLALLYATAAPGVLWGALDTFILAPIDALLTPRIDGADVQLSRRIGQGTFGSVYEGSYRGQAIIAKKAKATVEGADQLQRAEEYFNSRLRRSLALRRSAAPFIGSYTTFEDGPPILLWEDRGSTTLADLLEERDFVPALEDALQLTGTGDGAGRANRAIKAAFRQLVTGVKDLHAAGIVHRDLKPANVLAIRSTVGAPRLRIVDFGAAADMRTGANYEPKRGLLDPFYAAPEQLVLPDSTPPPPPAAIAAFLSPFLWAVFRPDLFDSYSLGLILVQLCVPALRRRNAMGPSGTFQRSLAAADYDLRRWRRENASNGVWDFSVLDYGGGLAFDLACGLVRQRDLARRGRLSCAAVLLHPWMLSPL